MASRLVTDETFEGTLRELSGAVFLYVWAPWCGPCKMVKPHYLAISEQNGQEAVFLDADLQTFSEVAEKMRVKTTPTLVAFRDGHEIARRSGALMRSQLQTWVDTQL
jgi:thioredoxin-like negative regulator of GroEL